MKEYLIVTHIVFTIVIGLSLIYFIKRLVIKYNEKSKNKSIKEDTFKYTPADALVDIIKSSIYKKWKQDSNDTQPIAAPIYDWINTNFKIYDLVSYEGYDRDIYPFRIIDTDENGRYKIEGDFSRGYVNELLNKWVDGNKIKHISDMWKFQKVRKIKEQGGILWFIEKTNNNRWLHKSINPPIIDYRWTDDPQMAECFLTEKEAIDSLWDIPNIRKAGVIATQHEFVGDNKGY